jgi:hypothetical protein
MARSLISGKSASGLSATDAWLRAAAGDVEQPIRIGVSSNQIRTIVRNVLPVFHSRRQLLANAAIAASRLSA